MLVHDSGVTISCDNCEEEITRCETGLNDDVAFELRECGGVLMRGLYFCLGCSGLSLRDIVKRLEEKEDERQVNNWYHCNRCNKAVDVTLDVRELLDPAISLPGHPPLETSLVFCKQCGSEDVEVRSE